MERTMKNGLLPHCHNKEKVLNTNSLGIKCTKQCVNSNCGFRTPIKLERKELE